MWIFVAAFGPLFFTVMFSVAFSVCIKRELYPVDSSIVTSKSASSVGSADTTFIVKNINKNIKIASNFLYLIFSTLLFYIVIFFSYFFKLIEKINFSKFKYETI